MFQARGRCQELPHVHQNAIGAWRCRLSLLMRAACLATQTTWQHTWASCIGGLPLAAAVGAARPRCGSWRRWRCRASTWRCWRRRCPGWQCRCDGGSSVRRAGSCCAAGLHVRGVRCWPTAARWYGEQGGEGGALGGDQGGGCIAALTVCLRALCPHAGIGEFGWRCHGTCTSTRLLSTPESGGALQAVAMCGMIDPSAALRSFS